MSDEQFSADVTDFKKLAKTAKAADKKIKAEFNKAVRASAKPAGEYVRVKAANGLPQGGGLAYLVAGASVTVSAGTMSASITVGKREGLALKGYDKGVIRKPVFGNRRVWADQPVTPNLFTDAFEEVKPVVMREMVTAGQRVLDQIAAES